MILQAPIYPPAFVFQQPVVAPRVLSVRGYSVAELMQQPDAWGVVVKHLPAMKFMANSAQAKPMLATMTVANFAELGGGDASATLAAIDADLAKLPASEGSAR